MDWGGHSDQHYVRKWKKNNSKLEKQYSFILNRLKRSVRLDWGHSDEQYQKREKITQNLHRLKCLVRLGYALGHADH